MLLKMKDFVGEIPDRSAWLQYLTRRSRAALFTLQHFRGQ
jgi:hypothetical protein